MSTHCVLRCRTRVQWQEASKADFAVGTLVGDAPDLWLSPSRAIVVTADGRLALAPCSAGGSCNAAGIDRTSQLVGNETMLDRSPGLALTWTVMAKP